MDRQPKDCSWLIRNWNELKILAGRGAAVFESLLATGEAEGYKYTATTIRFSRKYSTGLGFSKVKEMSRPSLIKRLQIGEFIGLAKVLHGSKGKVDAIAIRQSEQQLGLQGAFDMQVQFRLGNLLDE